MNSGTDGYSPDEKRHFLHLYARDVISCGLFYFFVQGGAVRFLYKNAGVCKGFCIGRWLAGPSGKEISV